MKAWAVLNYWGKSTRVAPITPMGECVSEQVF